MVLLDCGLRNCLAQGELVRQLRLNAVPGREKLLVLHPRRDWVHMDALLELRYR